MRKKTYVEALRIIAAFLVIVNHTNSRIFQNRTPDLTWFCSVAYFFLSRPAVPVFLLIMGGLLLGKEDSPRQSAGRILRILAVFVPGSLLYYLYYRLRRGEPISLGGLVAGFLSGTSTNAFWYFWLYLGLLCMLPILQKLVRALDRRQMKYLLVLSLGVNGLVPLAAILHPGLAVSKFFYQGLVGPYLGLVLMGYYLEQYVTVDHKKCLLCVGGLVLLTAELTFGTWLLYLRDSANYYALSERTLLPITVCAGCLYLCVKYLFTQHPLGIRLERAVCGLGRLTFGIYLLGDLAIDLSAPVYEALCRVMHVLPAMLLWELLIFACCALATAALRLVPVLRRVL